MYLWAAPCTLKASRWQLDIFIWKRPCILHSSFFANEVNNLQAFFLKSLLHDPALPARKTLKTRVNPYENDSFCYIWEELKKSGWLGRWAYFPVNISQVQAAR